LDWLSFPEDEMFDYTFCIEVVEHVAAEQVMPFLMKLRRHTKRNLFLSTPDSDRSSHGVTTAAIWKARLREAGFEVVAFDRQWTTLFICE
jgi:2-polyprenyl-3-methyl-5-hydroxy-6-metoxy-1,4-benzoquinol methylase